MSIIPVVFERLLAAYRTLPGLTPDEVRDSVSPVYAENRWVLVGPDNEPSTGEASDASTQRGGLTSRSPEVCRVPCSLWTGSGDTNPTQHRTAAFALFSAVEAYHATDRNLAGAVNDAHITSWRFRARGGTTGAGALITWVIQARKY